MGGRFARLTASDNFTPQQTLETFSPALVFAASNSLILRRLFVSNSFNARAELDVKGKKYTYYKLSSAGDVSRLPFSMKILLENLLRREDGVNVTADDIKFIANWDEKAEPNHEIAYMPARVLMQDFTGVPAVVDLAAMRDAMAALGGDTSKIEPLAPAELVIDHSVQVDTFGSANAATKNTEIEFQRNRERYNFLKWGQNAFETFKAVPPGVGIVHQVNLEFLARTVFVNDEALPIRIHWLVPILTPP